MEIKKIAIIAIFFAIWISNAFALACINISSGGVKETTMEANTENYISIRLYNLSADGKVCEEAYYKLEAELIDPEGILLQDVFDYKFSENNFLLRNGDNKQSLLTLIPKVGSGTYEIKVTGTRMPNEEGGMMTYIFTASATIEVTIGEGGDLTEVPFWTIRRDCPDGTVVKEGELCPFEIEEQNRKNMEMIAIGLVTVAMLGFAYFGFIRKKEPQIPTPTYPEYPEAMQNYGVEQKY